MATQHTNSTRRHAALLSPAPVFALLVVLLALAYWPGLDQPGKVPRDVLLLVGTPLLLGLSLLRRQARPRKLFLTLLGVVLISGLAHVVFAGGPERLAVARDLARMVALSCVALAVTLSVGDRERFDGALEGAAAVALLVIGLPGLAQAWFGWDGLQQLQPPASTFVNRNVAAQSLVALIPLVMPAVFAGRTRWFRWTAALSGGVGLAYLVATRTRGAWLGALTGAALVTVLLVLHRRKLTVPRQFSFPLALMLGLCVAALFVPVTRGPDDTLPSVGERLGDLSQPFYGSGVIRRALLENSAVMAVEYPLGVGPGRFSVVYPLYHEARRTTPGFGAEHQAEHTHNDLLEYATEFGMPAALALALLLVGAVALACRGNTNGSPLDLYRNAARAAALSGILIHGLVSFPLHSPASAFLGFLLLGRCWARPERTCSPSGATRVLAILALATLPLALWIGAREIRGQSALHDARKAQASGDCAAALDLADETYDSAPWKRRDVGLAAMIQFECTSDAESSLVALERALALHPHRLELLLATGARRLKAHRAAEAEAAFLHAVAVHPRHARAWLGLAMSRLTRNDRAGAAEACDRALRIDPNLGPGRTFCIGNGLI